MTLTSNIYMTIKSYKAFKVLTCTILCDLTEFLKVTGFKYLFRKIIDVKVEENYFFSTLASIIYHIVQVNTLHALNDIIVIKIFEVKVVYTI